MLRHPLLARVSVRERELHNHYALDFIEWYKYNLCRLGLLTL